MSYNSVLEESDLEKFDFFFLHRRKKTILKMSIKLMV